MATYSTIKGFTIQSYASDPAAPGVAGATWASGATINTARQSVAAFGNPVATTAVIAGGTTGLITEEYNGTVWAEVNNLTGSATNSAGSAGTVTAGVYFGGSFGPPGNTNITQKYDGTSWTTSGTMNTARRSMASGGTQTAAFAALGANVPTFVTSAETYDGSTWSSINSCLTARRSGAGSGTTTAALAFGGYTVPGAIADQTETYDGSSWSETNDLNTGRTSLAGSGAGTNTAALAMGGDTPPATAVTEYFDGTSWTEVADLSRARVAGGSGTSTDAFIAGGSPEPSPATYSSESEFFSTGTSIVQEGQVWYNTTSTVLKGFGKQGTGAWASGGTMNAPYVYSAGYCGTQTAGVFAGGIPGDVTTTQTYNGSVWAASPATLTVGRHYMSSTGIGTLTAAMLFGGEGSPTFSNSTEQFNGTAWTAVNNLITGRIAIAGAGTQAGALAMTGYGGAETAAVEDWDGTSWSAGTAAPQAKNYAMGGGTYTSAILAGGYNGGNLNTSDEWNGTSWTETANINTARTDGSRGAGSGTAALIFGGGAPPTNRKHTEQWDGSTWTTVQDLTTTAGSNAGNGTSMVAISVAGNPPLAGQTEEWNIPNAIKTFTAS